MLGKVAKLITQPGKYIPMARRMMLQKCCWLFQDASFFLQGQMDIHPRANWHTQDLVKLTGGFYPRPDDTGRRICNLDAHDNTRRDMLILLLRTVIDHGVTGAFAELGVYKGFTARLIHHYAPERVLHLFDTFEGFTARSAAAELRSHRQTTSLFSDTSLESVKAFVAQRNQNVSFHKGFFPESIPPSLRDETFAFVHLDADLYDPIYQGLTFFYPRIPRRGMIVVHDYNSWPGSRKAVDEFFRDKAELPIPMPDKSGSVLIVKS